LKTGVVEVHGVFSIVLFWGLLSLLPATDTPSSRHLYKEAQKAAEYGYYERALELFHQAIRQSPKNKQYLDGLEDCKVLYLDELTSNALAKWPSDVTYVLQMVQKAKELEVDRSRLRNSPSIETRWENLNRLIQEKVKELEFRTQELMGEIKLGQFDAAAYFLLRNQDYFPLVPGLINLSNELRIQYQLKQSNGMHPEAIDKDDDSFSKLVAVLKANPDHPDVLYSVREFVSECKNHLARSEISVWEQYWILRKLDKLAELIPSDQSELKEEVNNSKRSLEQVQRDYVVAIQRIIGSIDVSGASAANRTVLEILLSHQKRVELPELGTLIADRKSRLSENLLYRIQVRNLSESKFPIGQADLCKDLPPPSRLSTRTDYEIHLDIRIYEIDLPRCEEKAKLSNYTVSYIQKINPRYAQVESELYQAKFSLATAQIQRIMFLIGWWAVSVGLLENTLEQTPPFFDEPVIAPYQYVEYQVRRELKLKADLVLRDKRQVELGRIELLDQVESVQTGIADALPQDRNGIHNISPKTVPFADLYQSLRARSLPKIRGNLRSLIGSVYLDLALAAYERADIPAVIGYALLSGDQQQSELSDFILSKWVENDRLIGTLRALGDFAVLFGNRQEDKGRRQTAQAGNPTDLVKKAMPAIVMIETQRGSLASGFIFDPSGLVATNHHVIENAGLISVQTHTGDVFLGKLLHADESKDLAVLQIDYRTTEFLMLGNSGQVRIGEDILVLGNPEGLQWTVTKGIVSALRRSEGISYIQIDAAINHGNSGGPVINKRGEVSGIISFKLVNDAIEGLGFSVAVDELKSLISKGR